MSEVAALLGVHRIVAGPLAENTYVVSGPGGDAIVIDPGGGFQQIAAHVEANDLTVHAVVNTHAHEDHLGAAMPVVEAYGAPFHLHPADRDLLQRANFYRTLIARREPISIPPIDVPLADLASLDFGALRVIVLHTPGHTPGGVCLEIAGELFTGDTLMALSTGRTDLPGGDRETLEASVDRVRRRYPPETRLHPGHGEPASLGDVLARFPTLPEARG